jgi:hypothetical protein
VVRHKEKFLARRSQSVPAVNGQAAKPLFAAMASPNQRNFHLPTKGSALVPPDGTDSPQGIRAGVN